MAAARRLARASLCPLRAGESILSKLDLPKTQDDHRRVRAVVTSVEAH